MRCRAALALLIGLVGSIIPFGVSEAKTTPNSSSLRSPAARTRLETRSPNWARALKAPVPSDPRTMTPGSHLRAPSVGRVLVARRTSRRSAIPVVVSMSVSAGPIRGGTQVIATGHGFSRVRSVLFNSSPAVSVRVLSSTRLEFTSPAHPAGLTKVTVQVAGGTSSPGAASRFQYDPVPVVTVLSSSSGPLDGGVTLTVKGANFLGATSVQFGSAIGTHLIIRSAKTLQVTTPAWVGPVYVRVITPGGDSSETSRSMYRFVTPSDGESSTFVPHSGAVTASTLDVSAVSGGDGLPWTVDLASDANVPSSGAYYFLPPGGDVYPTGLAGTVTSVVPQGDGSTEITVAQAPISDVLDEAEVSYTGPLTGSQSGSSSHDQGEVVQLGGAGTRKGLPLSSSIDFGSIDGSNLGCKDSQGNIASSGDLTGSLTLSLENVKANVTIDTGATTAQPYVAAWVYYEATVGFNLNATESLTCTLPAAWQNENEKLFLIGDTGATIAIAPDLTFTISASGNVSVSQNTYHMIGFTTNPDGSIQKLTGESADPAVVTASASLEAQAYAGIQVQIGELNVVGVGISAGGGLKGSITISGPPNPQVCASVTPFLQATLYAYLNLWVQEWKLQAFQVNLNLATWTGCKDLTSHEPPSNAANHIFTVTSTGASYYIDASDMSHWIPSTAIYDCLLGWDGVVAIQGTQQQLATFPGGSNESCQVTQAFRTIIEGSDGTSYYVDGSGVAHWIPNGGTFLCLYDWDGVSLYNNLTDAQLGAFPVGSNESCQVTKAFGDIIEGSDGTSYYVDGSGVAHWIPNGGTFSCLYYWDGVSLYKNLTQAQLDTFPVGSNESCQVTKAFGDIIEGSDGTSYYVDDSGVAHWIPNGGTFSCLYYWDDVSLWSNLSVQQLDTFPVGSNESCQVTKVFGDIIEGSDGTSYYVDGSGVAHWIPNGGTFSCLYYWDGVSLWSNLSVQQLDTFPVGSNESCQVTKAFNTVLRQSDGTAWYVDDSGDRHWIQNGATYNCLVDGEGLGLYNDVSVNQVDTFAEGSYEPDLTC
jgi:hypothetical protein